MSHYSVALAACVLLAGCQRTEEHQNTDRGDTHVLASNDERACTYTNGGPRPPPPIPSGANEQYLAKGNDTAQLTDTFEPVWGRVCLQNGPHSILDVTANLPDGTTRSVKIHPSACADFRTESAKIRANCDNDQPQVCQKYNYTRLRKCSGDAHPVSEDILPHASHVFYRFDVNPSAIGFMTQAANVRISKPWPATFLISDKLATVEVCKKFNEATLMAYADAAGTGSVSKSYVFREQPRCFTVQGRNLTVRLNIGYIPPNLPPTDVLSYKILSF